MTRNPSRPGFFREHPVRPVAHQDPLLRSKGVYLAPGSEKGMGVAEARPRIGFACRWDEIPERTWSYTPWNLREALRSVTETTDTGFQIPRLSRTVLRAIHTRYHGRVTSTWGSSPLTQAYVERALRRELSRTPATSLRRSTDDVRARRPLPVPFFIYSDISYDAAISAARRSESLCGVEEVSPSTVARLRDRQVSIYERASGIIAMSHWFARSLVQQTGVPEEKIHVVHAGDQQRGQERPSPGLT